MNSEAVQAEMYAAERVAQRLAGDVRVALDEVNAALAPGASAADKSAALARARERFGADSASLLRHTFAAAFAQDAIAALKRGKADDLAEARAALAGALAYLDRVRHVPHVFAGVGDAKRASVPKRRARG